MRAWLGQEQKQGRFTAKKLDAASKAIDAELISSVDELVALRNKGRLSTVFKQQGVLLAIEEALERIQPKQAELKAYWLGDGGDLKAISVR